MKMPFVQSAFYFMRNAHELVGQKKLVQEKYYTYDRKKWQKIDLSHCKVNFTDEEMKKIVLVCSKFVKLQLEMMYP